MEVASTGKSDIIRNSVNILSCGTRRGGSHGHIFVIRIIDLKSKRILTFRTSHIVEFDLELKPEKRLYCTIWCFPRAKK